MNHEAIVAWIEDETQSYLVALRNMEKGKLAGQSNIRGRIEVLREVKDEILKSLEYLSPDEEPNFREDFPGWCMGISGQDSSFRKLNKPVY